MKKNTGITLIALVITIVVLIILASVAITLSLGENGVFRKAAKAREDTKVAQNEESMQIAETTNSIDEITGTRATNDTNTPTIAKAIKLEQGTDYTINTTVVRSCSVYKLSNMVYVNGICNKVSGISLKLLEFANITSANSVPFTLGAYAQYSQEGYVSGKIITVNISSNANNYNFNFSFMTNE